MRNTTLAIQSLLIGALFTVSFAAAAFGILPSAAHAATVLDPANGYVPEADTKATTPPATAEGACPDGLFKSIKGGCVTQAEQLQDAIGAKRAGTDAAVKEIPNKVKGVLKCADDFGNCLLDAVATFVLGFANFMLGIAGVLLNWVVVKTVFQFSQLIGNSQGLLVAWGILRDIGNLLLLFGFVLMGIGTILDTSKLPDKKAIPMLIIFAVLLNFSIFAAEAVIDTSNVLTSVLYSQANTDPCNTEACDINQGIAGHIMQSTGLSGIYALKPADASEGTKKFIVLIGLSIFSLIGTVVLLAAALMLAFRAITLTGLIIVSPIGFAGMAIKPLQGMARKWWNMLIHQAFFAPILFLLIFVSLKVTEGFASASNNNNLAHALTGAGTSNMGIIMVFVLISGALIASLMAAKSFGAMGADFAVKTAGTFAFGSGAFVGRRTIGAGSAAVSRSIKSSSFGATTMGKTFAGIADRGAASSFDARKAVPKAFGKATKLDLGTPGKTAAGGYTAIEKKGIEDRTKYAAGLTLSPDAKKEDERLKTEKKKVTAKFKDEKKLKETERKNEITDAAERSRAFTGDIANLQKIVDDPDSERARIQQQIELETRRQGELLSRGSTAEALQMNAPLAALRQQLTDVGSATQRLESVKEEQRKEEERSKVRRETIQAAQIKLEKDEENALKDLDKAIQMNSPKGIYADNLEKSLLNKLPIGVAQANKKAAEKIKAEFKKTKLDNAFSGLEKAIKDSKDGTVKMDDVIEAVKETEEEKEEETGAK